MRWPLRQVEARMMCRIRGRAWRSWGAILEWTRRISRKRRSSWCRQTVKLGADHKQGSLGAGSILCSTARLAGARRVFFDGDESLRPRPIMREKDFPVRFPDVSSVKIVSPGVVELRWFGIGIELLPIEKESPR